MGLGTPLCALNGSAQRQAIHYVSVPFRSSTSHVTRSYPSCTPAIITLSKSFK